jgi:hypothetical protein
MTKTTSSVSEAEAIGYGCHVDGDISHLVMDEGKNDVEEAAPHRRRYWADDGWSDGRPGTIVITGPKLRSELDDRPSLSTTWMRITMSMDLIHDEKARRNSFR